MAIVVYTPIFTLQRVEVSGISYLTREQVLEIGRIHTGEPLFQLQTDAVAQNLMHDLRIESAVVRRRLPDRLEIEVVERKPVATVACDYGYLDLDHNGKIIAAYRALHSVPIPLITGMEVKGLYLGDEVKDENVKKVLYFLSQIDTEALNQISEVNIANPDGVVAYANSSVQDEPPCHRLRRFQLRGTVHQAQGIRSESRERGGQVLSEIFHFAYGNPYRMMVN